MLKDATSVNAPRMWVITRGVQPVGSHPEPNEPQWRRHLFADCVELSLWSIPNCGVSALIWIHATASGTLGCFISELFVTDNEDQVAFRQGTRHVAKMRRASLGIAPASVATVYNPDGTYLITGGFGDLVYKWRSLWRVQLGTSS